MLLPLFLEIPPTELHSASWSQGGVGRCPAHYEASREAGARRLADP